MIGPGSGCVITTMAAYGQRVGQIRCSTVSLKKFVVIGPDKPAIAGQQLVSSHQQGIHITCLAHHPAFSCMCVGMQTWDTVFLCVTLSNVILVDTIA